VAEEGSEIHAAHYVPAARDRFRGQREIRFTRTVIDFKVSTLDTDGGLFVAEITSLQKGEPAVRRFVEREHEVVHWSEFGRGGHFAAMEAPDLLVGDVRAFFRWFR
jgi:hypothetical protein